MTGIRKKQIAALDVGTSKVTCFLAESDESGSVEVHGIGHLVSNGMKAGSIIDMEAVGRSIRAAVETAERMAEVTAGEIWYCLNAAKPKSRTIRVEVDIDGHEVSDQDMSFALDYIRMQQDDPDRMLVHTLPVSYAIDDSQGIRDPRLMLGERLGVDVHMISAAAAPVRNLETCIEDGHLDIGGSVFSPYASGLACLSDEEMSLGATVIDLGAGTTGVGIFVEDAFVYGNVLPVGGAHITKDIAYGLVTGRDEAERIKARYGNALPAPTDDHHIIDVRHAGEDGPEAVTRIPASLLSGIIRPRLEETFEMIREDLELSGFDKIAGRRVVLTGGASQMPGVRELAAMVLDKQVRLGRPVKVPGLAEATSGPAFAACAGTLIYVARDLAAQEGSALPRLPASAGMFARMGNWLREHF